MTILLPNSSFYPVRNSKYYSNNGLDRPIFAFGFGPNIVIRVGPKTIYGIRNFQGQLLVDKKKGILLHNIHWKTYLQANLTLRNQIKGFNFFSLVFYIML